MEMRVRIVATETDHTAWVEALPDTSSCHSCSSSKASPATAGCGADNIGRMFTGNAPHHFRVIDALGCQKNDEVIIDIKDGSVLRSAIAVYFFPLALIFLGAILASKFSPPSVADLAAVLGAVLGLIVSAVCLHKFNLRIRHNPNYQPLILRKLPKTTSIPIAFAHS